MERRTVAKVVGLALLGVVLLAPLSLSQVPRGRIMIFRRPIRPPVNIDRRATLPTMDIGALEDALEHNTVAAGFARVEGTVFDESGKRAAGIQVFIEATDSSHTYKTTTDKSGRYTYSGLQTGNYLMGVVYMGKIGLPTEVPLRVGRVTEHDFELKDFEDIGVTGNDLSALKALLKAPPDVEIAPNASEDLLRIYDKAKEAASRGDHETAVALLKELVEKAPGESAFWRRLGESYFELSNYADAASAFRKAMELRPDVAEYPALLAFSLLFIGNMDEAEQYTQRTAALDKRVGAEAYYNLGLALTDGGEAVRAEGAFAKATELNDRHASAFFQLGLTLLSTHANNLADAKKPLERFLRLTPEAEEAMTAQDLIAEINNAERKGK